jgi:hypothetical protein
MMNSLENQQISKSQITHLLNPPMMLSVYKMKEGDATKKRRTALWGAKWRIL